MVLIELWYNSTYFPRPIPNLPNPISKIPYEHYRNTLVNLPSLMGSLSWEKPLCRSLRAWFQNVVTRTLPRKSMPPCWWFYKSCWFSRYVSKPAELSAMAWVCMIKRCFEQCTYQKRPNVVDSLNIAILTITIWYSINSIIFPQDQGAMPPRRYLKTNGKTPLRPDS